MTIRDIAKKANVSVATVSRVINQSKSVSPEIEQRVRAIIKESGFQPNSMAKGLVTKQSKMIGLIIPDISNTVFGALTKGINSVCQKEGYTLMVCESGGTKENELALLEVLSSKSIDGLLFAGVDVDDSLVSLMKAKDFPVLLVTQEASGQTGQLPTVAHDNIQAVYEAVTFLINNGHRRIAFIGGRKDDYSSGKKRLIGYQKALEENAIQVPDAYIEYGEFSFESGNRCMKKIYEENEVLPTAVMACSDLIAFGAIQFLRTVQIPVPDEISVMGFDDLELTQYFAPALSTVRISYFDEGAQAAKTLFEQMNAEKVSLEPIYLPHKIIRRSSTKRIIP